MKFYIISTILNILLLFIPVAIPTIENKKKENDEMIKVTLKNENFNMIGQNEEKNENIKEIFEKKEEKVENQIINKKTENIDEKNENKENNIVSLNSKKIDNKTILNSSKVLESNKNTLQRNRSINSSDNTSENTVGIGNGTSKKENSNISNSENNNSSSKSGKNIGSEGNVCREGIDYIVNYTPTLPYPVAAQRTGITGDVIINVKFNFTNEGKISVISVSGGNPAFYSDAKKATAKIKVTIKNKETLKCTITKPYRFKKI